MRIVGGIWRGRRLVAPTGRAHRPTQARVREALFSLLGTPLRAAWVLDLFAGSGSLGLEALSRGAARALFVERSSRALTALRENVQRCGAEGHTSIVRAEVERFLSGARGPYGAIALAMADPPYELDASGLLEMMVRAPALEWSHDARIVIEHGADAPAPRVPAGWRSATARRYGDTCLSIAARESDRSHDEGGQ
ncbi:MAG: 16S rRNA (guanine(966)-N(2))-methyltransferase RsmD [Candidatus Eisenbacteria bacterium]|nr:16S rRNA (guanine(966)-N(2))-methyltransferase RsmD [Candidatus Eisenbacteria bacterium]